MSNEKEINCFAIPHRRTIWEKLGFGFAYAKVPQDVPAGMADGWITSETISVLDWKDWLRVLFSGKISLETKTVTNVPVEKAVSYSAIKILPPTFKPVKP